jgi:lipoprotein signal peptidase
VTELEVVQLSFAVSNGVSFSLTIRHEWWAKLFGSLTLVIAHPVVAMYFLVTDQKFFIIGNAIMTAGGIYGIWRALTQRRAQRVFEEEETGYDRASQ